METIGNGGRRWATAACRRRPLLAAAMVATTCVLVADRSVPAAAILGLAAAAIGGWLGGWKTGLAWLCCGGFAVAVFIGRTTTRASDERTLLAFSHGEMHGRVLRDAKAGGLVWRTPVILDNGPRVGAKVWWEGRGEMPVAGARVRARGSFGPLPEPRNPGEFNQAAWLRNQGVAAVFQAGWVEGQVKTVAWAAQAAKFRRGFREAVAHGLPEDSKEAVVIRAIVIGEQAPDAEELIAWFRNCGTLHAFSVSGLHVAMVASIGWFVLRWLGVSRRRAVVLLLPLIFGYSWLTGNSQPAVRSAWMAAVFLGAFVTRRRPDLLNALGAVLLAATLWDGRLLFLPGVQLSYGVVAAIALGVGLTSRWFTWMALPPLYLPLARMNFPQKAWLWLRRKTAQSFAVSVAAGVGSTPLTIFHFGLVTPVSIFAGVLMVPAVFALLIVALLAVAIYPLQPGATQWVNRGNGVVADLCILIARGFSAVPGGHAQLRQDPRAFLLVYDLDHGAGAACFSGSDGETVLFDCADPNSFRRRLVPSLLRQGVVPDSVVISHPDGGHLGGGAAVWTAFPIHQAWLPVEKSRSPAFRMWATEAPQAGVRIVRAADVRHLAMPDGARLEVLHVPDADSQNAVADERVAVFRLHWRGWKLLFTNDAGMSTELQMLASGRDLSADVIIAGHHRTDASLSDAFLNAVNPQAIVASHSEFPAAEKRDPASVAYWRSRGIQVIHQGESGGVTIHVEDDGNLRLDGFVDHSVTLLKPR